MIYKKIEPGADLIQKFIDSECEVCPKIKQKTACAQGCRACREYLSSGIMLLLDFCDWSGFESSDPFLFFKRIADKGFSKTGRARPNFHGLRRKREITREMCSYEYYRKKLINRETIKEKEMIFIKKPVNKDEKIFWNFLKECCEINEVFSVGFFSLKKALVQWLKNKEPEHNWDVDPHTKAPWIEKMMQRAGFKSNQGRETTFLGLRLKEVMHE